MDPTDSKEIFPRQLTEQEIDWLNTALPLDKIGYKIYRDKIEKLFVIGYGRWGYGNYILGKPGSLIDLNDSSAPVFAVAEIIFDKLKVYVSIHEELENLIEIDIRKSGDETGGDLMLIEKWSYSNWVSGEKAPSDNSDVREINIVKNSIILAIAPRHKKIWLHSKEDGVNRIIPVSNYYNEVMMGMNNRDSKIMLNPNRLFNNLEEFSDEDLSRGFLSYNKRWKRIEFNYSSSKSSIGSENKKSFFNF